MTIEEGVYFLVVVVVVREDSFGDEDYDTSVPVGRWKLGREIVLS